MAIKKRYANKLEKMIEDLDNAVYVVEENGEKVVDTRNPNLPVNQLRNKLENRYTQPIQQSSKKQEKSTWLSKGDFEDGFDVLDIPKVILGTVGDVGLNAFQGVGNIVEGLVDLGTYGLAEINDITGNEKKADKLRKRAQRNMINEKLENANDFLDEHSILGEKTDNIAQGLGQVGAIILTGGIGSAAGLSGAGVTALTTGVTGLSSMGSGMGEAYQGGATDEEALTYGAITGTAEAVTELIFGGLGKAVNAVGLSKGLTSLDDAFAKKVTSKISNQIAKNFVEYGIKAGAEGTEEVLSGIMQAAGKKMTYMSEEDWKQIIKDEQLLDQFIMGTVTSGFAQSGIVPGMKQGSLIEANKTGRDFITGYTQNEQKVIDSIVTEQTNSIAKQNTIENEVKKAIESKETEQGGILSTKEKNAIREQILAQIDSGKIDTSKTKVSNKEISKIRESVEEQMQKGLLDTNTIESILPNTDFSKDSFLQRSYLEKARKSENFTYDNEITDTKEKAVYDSASKYFNNTTRSHEFVEKVAKISKERGTNYAFINNEELKSLGHDVEGKQVNGLVRTNKDGEQTVLINIDSPKALNTIVGHETTHLLEGTQEYQDLQEAIFNYAKEKGDFEARQKSLSKLYDGIDNANIDSEITADLVGDYLFTDDKFIDSLSTQKPTVFQKIKDLIDDLVIKFKGTKEEKQLREVQKKFKEAYKQNTSNFNDPVASIKNAQKTEKTVQKLEKQEKKAPKIAKNEQKVAEKEKKVVKNEIQITKDEIIQRTKRLQEIINSNANENHKPVSDDFINELIEQNIQLARDGGKLKEESISTNEELEEDIIPETQEQSNISKEWTDKVNEQDRVNRPLAIEQAKATGNNTMVGYSPILSNYKLYSKGSLSWVTPEGKITTKVIDESEIDSFLSKNKIDRLNKGINPFEIGLSNQNEENDIAPSETEFKNYIGISKLKQKYDSANKVRGNSHSIVLNDGQKLSGTYVLTESGSVTSSHNSKNFTKSENFPLTEQGTTINDRDYENDKMAQQEVIRKAQIYDGRAFNDNGVIVTKDGIVVSGNDRTMAGEIASRNNTDQAYIEYLKENAEQFGFTKEQIESMKHPRVVLELDKKLEYNTKTFAKFNKDSKKTKSVSEKAKEIGKTIDDNTITKISNVFDNYDTIDQVYNSQKATKDLMELMLNRGIIEENEISQVYDGEKFTGAGKDLIEATIIGSVVNEENVKYFRNNNNLKFKIMKSAPTIIQNKTLGDYSIIDEINNAMNTYKNAQQSNMTVDEFCNQTNIFGDSDVDLVTKRIAKILENKGYKELKNFIDKYNDLAIAPAKGQVDLFTGKVPTKESILNQALNINEDTELETKQYSLTKATDEQISKAEALENQNKTAEEIYLETGAYRGADGRWRAEIDDSNSKILLDVAYLDRSERHVYKLEQILDHHELYKAYPGLKRLNVEFKDIGDYNGRYDPNSNTFEINTNLYNQNEDSPRRMEKFLKQIEENDPVISLLYSENELKVLEKKYREALKNSDSTLYQNNLKSTLMHEIQHFIQEQEGFAKGTNLEEKQRATQKYKEVLREKDGELSEYYEKIGVSDWIKENMPRLQNGEITIDQFFEEQTKFKYNSEYGKEIKKLREEYQEYQNRYKVFARDPYDLYKNTAGEIEAREVQKRLNYTKEQRQNEMPFVKDDKTVYAEPTLNRRYGIIPTSNSITQYSISDTELKQKQLDIILKTNPMQDDYHVGIRSVDDIKTFEEAMQDDESFYYGDFELEDAERALEEGKITVYSSKPIEQGGFVSTSYNMAKDYAGGGKIYSQTVALNDVAWINGDEGQYAKVSNIQYSLTDNQGRNLTKEQQDYFKNSKVRDENGNLLTVYHGTRADFNIFESERAGQNYENGWSQSGEGFYFTDNITEAKEFGEYSEGKGTPNVKEVYLNITNPFDTSQENTPTLAEIGKEYGVDPYFLQRGDYLLRWFRNNGINASEVLQKYGFDGIYDYGHYVVYDSNKIKNVDNLKPTSDNDIRYSLSDNQGRTLTKNQQEYFKNVIPELKDENNNLKVLYHGTPNVFTQFNYDFIGTNGTALGKGFYLTDSKDIANSYVGDGDGHIMEVYANITKPMSLDELNISKRDFKKFVEAVDKATEGQYLSDYGEVDYEGYNTVLNRALENYDYNDNDVDLVHDVFNTAGLSWEDGFRLLKETLGYDGVIQHNFAGSDATVYVPTLPEQIKSITNQNPTNNLDINLSLSNLNEDIAPIGDYNVYGKDIKLAPLEKEIESLVANLQNFSKKAPDRKAFEKTVEESAKAIKNELGYIPKDPTKESSYNEEQKEIAKILVEEPKTQKQRNARKWAIFRASIFDKGTPFEDLSLKTRNRELMGKWDYTLTSEARGQNIIGKGHFEDGIQTSKSLNDIRAEVDNTGLTKEFYHYMYHKHNVDRMSLVNKAKQKMINLTKTTLSGYKHNQIVKMASENWLKSNTEKLLLKYNQEELDNIIESAKEYVRLSKTMNKPVFGDNVTSEMSQEIVNQYELQHPEFMDYAQDVYDYVNADKRLLVQNGITSQETADLWSEMYPKYVPIRRANQDGNAINVPLDTNRTGVNAPIKRATGGSSDILPLFDTMAMRTLQTQRAIAKNNFGVELKNTLGTTIESSKTDLENFVDSLENSLENQEGLLQEGKDGKNPTFTVFENGNKVTFEITQDMYDALKPVSERLSKTVKPLNIASNFHRGVLTEYNPVFMLTNSIKDVQEIIINSQHARKTYAKIPEATAQLFTRGYWYQEYVNNGGEQNSYFDNETNTFDTKKNIILEGKFSPLKWISAINNTIEMAPRLAEYIASRESGRSIEVSMLDAARVTTNFKAGGDLTKALNRNGFTFLNASVQGAMQQVRNVREANANGLKGWVNLATKFAVAGLTARVLNDLLWSDDDEYEDLSDYVKQNYYVVAKDDDGTFIRIPKGRTVAVIQESINQMSNLITGDDEVDLKNFIDLAITNLAPNNPLDNNILSPIVDVLKNEAWYGGDLVPSRLQDLPSAEQYDESTDKFSRWLGEKTGWSPYKINYLIDQYSGGIGDVVLPMITPEKKNKADSLGGYLTAPFKDKFTTNATMNNQNISDFYDISDELTKKANSSKATDKDVLSNKYINSVKSEMSELYQEKREIQNSNLSNSKKYDKVLDIQAQINELAEEALSQFSSVSIDSNYSTVGDREYYKKINDEGEVEWTKIKDEELEDLDSLGLSNSRKNSYFKAKSEISSIVSDYKDDKAGISGFDEDSEEYQDVVDELSKEKQKKIIEEVLNTNLNDEQKAYLYSKYYSSEDSLDNIVSNGTSMNDYLTYKLDTIDYVADKDEDGDTVDGSLARKKIDYLLSSNLSTNDIQTIYENDILGDFDNPKKHKGYKAAKTSGVDINTWLDYNSQEFEADYNAKGNAISGSRKAKVISYVNSLDLSIPQKAILIKSTNTFKFNDYNNQIIDYVSELDMTYDEKVYLLESLDMTVYDDGTVIWK